MLWVHLAQLNAVVGTVLPLLIAVVQQTHWSRTVKTVVGLTCSVVASVLVPEFYTKLTWNTWGYSAVFLIGAVLATYRNIWVPIGAAPAIERKTTIGKKS